jgi:hypothetical protein
MLYLIQSKIVLFQDMRSPCGLLMLCVAVAMTACNGDQSPQFNAAADKDNQLSVNIENETAVIDVQSPSGIGKAQIEFLSGNYPAQIILRLHIQKLEGFKLIFGRTTVSAASSATSGTATQSLIESDGSERALTPSSPLWIGIQPEQQYLEITLPTALIREKPESFSFQWVDFYR